nr:hypothetical protein [Tanacetum cinerariifolium]
MIDNIDQDVEITLVDETQERINEEEMFGVNDLDGDEVIVDATTGEEVEQSTKVAEKEVSTVDPVTTAGEVVTTAEDVKVTPAATTAQISKDKLTLAQTLIEIKAAKPKARGVIVQEPNHELAERLQAEEQRELTIEETDELYMKIIPDDEIAIDAIPLASKPPIIVDLKIIKEGKISSYHLIRGDGSSKRYPSMIQMLQHINREDLKTLWKLVKAKYGNTRPKEGYESVLWGDLKVMFEPDIESEVWRKLQGNKVTIWKLFSSRGVHFVRF